MICEECGEPTNTRFFIPVQNPLRRSLNSLTDNVKQGKWICEKCLAKMKKKS
jgi:hypothetical protein